ncbi:spondin domain-containing protein [Photobacterium aphoticum]|uniref:Spondin domain-containing protein n=1 Tax=Photobacterium aphoticum TaxID=754436 RepID=A0A0J1GS62_9GAMM|nr:spondin domain-containing protein [Photobacterium aphoticum]KLV02496.1 hypothetical protein ABT58_03010 [Photobacterium aphoticum]PSU56938.1 hypothetical protein C9I90_11300 [Photobacterium aphoticum]GHA64680.1 hypothetical protein GCM10007086_42960 [Photobacterium aphoticum]
MRNCTRKGNIYRSGLLALSVLLLAGCPNDDDDNGVTPIGDAPTPNTEGRFVVEVTNLTANQPLSPVALIAHHDDYQLFEIGQPASLALEALAESGDNSDVLAEKDSNTAIIASYGGTGVIPPANGEQFTLSLPIDSPAYLTVASMLVNTNDAFVSERSPNLSDLLIGEMITVSVPVWDAGTEDNTETAATIPGPAGGGEGFNSARESNDRVSFHPGVVSQDDRLATSALSANHRFLNPGVSMRIMRVE